MILYVYFPFLFLVLQVIFSLTPSHLGFLESSHTGCICIWLLLQVSYQFCWEKIKHLCHLRRRYVQLYADSLQGSDIDSSELKEIEEDLRAKVILLWRQLSPGNKIRDCYMPSKHIYSAMATTGRTSLSLRATSTSLSLR